MRIDNNRANVGKRWFGFDLESYNEDDEARFNRLLRKSDHVIQLDDNYGSGHGLAVYGRPEDFYDLQLPGYYNQQGLNQFIDEYEVPEEWVVDEYNRILKDYPSKATRILKGKLPVR